MTSFATWALVLTLFGPFERSPVAITTLQGFRTKEACMTAAAEWLKQVSRAELKSALCVPQ